jgi:hypothetical protein
MKNIHLIPTKNQYKGSISLTPDGRLSTNVLIGIPYNLCITSDEVIKEGDWVFDSVMNVFVLIDTQTGLHTAHSWKKDVYKIILTTDTDLIADGVQAIDDAFLEWFIKNPSCEEVKVDLVAVNEFGSEITVGGYGFDRFIYKIIIPQEEPKQETLEEVRKVERSDLYNKIYSIVKQIPREDVETDAMDASSCAYDIEQLFYKWQAERMYSEEEAIQLLIKFNQEIQEVENVRDWFEQFKKK